MQGTGSEAWGVVNRDKLACWVNVRLKSANEGRTTARVRRYRSICNCSGSETQNGKSSRRRMLLVPPAADQLFCVQLYSSSSYLRMTPRDISQFLGYAQDRVLSSHTPTKNPKKSSTRAPCAEREMLWLMGKLRPR